MRNRTKTSIGIKRVEIKQLRLWCAAALLFWSILLSGSLALYVQHEWQSVEFIGKKIGLTAVNKDYTYELWNAHNGGVYVPVDDRNQPNSYLSGILERDIVTPSGKQLTLINPAHMTRQAYRIEQEIYGIGGHTVSLDAVRPENTPDAWERNALQSFLRGEKDAAKLIKKGDKTFMRVIIPAITQESCLRCHIRKNDQAGDIRGGISITFPIDGIVDLFQSQFKTSALYHLLIYLIGITGLVVFYVRMSRQMNKRAAVEEQLRRQTEEWQNTFDAIPDIITLQDSEMRIIRANKATYEFFEATPDELIGSACYSLFHEETGTCPNCPDCREIGSIADGYRDKYRHCGTAEHKLLENFFHICSAPVLDEQGELQYLVYIARDITDKKKLEEELFQARKMEAIGTLAGGIAHDFNNILAAILGYTEIIQLSLPKDSPLEHDLQQIILAGNRAGDLIKQILTFSRKKQQRKEELHINRTVRDALKMMRSSLPTTIDIQEDIDEQCGLVFADPTNIHQIILNLFTNAFHAVGKKQGTLHLGLKPVVLSAERVADKPGVQAGSFVELTVRDNGQGMDEITMSRIFDPYFTTKEQGAGTGLGLAVIHGIVEDCNGFIEVASVVGQGAAFHVFLPTIPAESRLNNGEKTVQETSRMPLPGGKERILFVDDEADLTRISQAQLNSLGYKVTVATRSLKAWEEFQKDPNAFDLLITDHTMPGLTGGDLARSVLQLRPDLPVILCTGYTAAFSEQEALEAGIKKYVIKPLSARKLAETVREVLDEQA